MAAHADLVDTPAKPPAPPRQPPKKIRHVDKKKMIPELGMTIEQMEEEGKRIYCKTPDQLADLMEHRSRFNQVPEKTDLDRDFDGIQGVTAILKSAHTGLRCDKRDLDFRRHYFGPNKFDAPPSSSFLRLFLEAFTDKTIIILCVSAIISIILSEVFPSHEIGDPPGWIEGTAILISVVIVTITSSMNNWTQERQFRKLNEQQKARSVAVYRDGEPATISIFDLVVGDVVKLAQGDALPADGICIHAVNLSADESTMTGESETVRKSPENDCFLLCGCKIAEGSGLMLTTAVGMNSQFGKLKAMLSKPREDTPLQVKLGKVANIIGLVGLAVAVVTFIVLLVQWIIKAVAGWDPAMLARLMRHFITAITIVVVAVPEGLPLAVTIALAFSMQRMLKDHNLVRRLESCETMGGATTVCSDKTGTLTMNKMTVVAGFLAGTFYEDARALRLDQLPPGFVDLIAESLSVNSSTELVELTDAEAGATGAAGKLTAKDQATVARARAVKGPKVQGNMTEGALLIWVKNVLHLEYGPIRAAQRLIQQWPFSSAQKKMATLVDRGEVARLHVKGASEWVTKSCTQMLTGTGVAMLTPGAMCDINKTIDRMASSGLRTLTIAYRDIPSDQVPAMPTPAASPPSAPGTPASTPRDPDRPASTPTPSPHPDQPQQTGPYKDIPENDLVLAAVIGIEDPLRPEVVGAVQDCVRAGIMVRMVTGDNVKTAKKIAEQAGIYKPTQGGLALEGPEFRQMDADAAKKLLPQLQVLARSSPTDKHLLVGYDIRAVSSTSLVAVTGDGTNDAPALALANVGFSMGISGTEVAATHPWGRNVYDSIRKFLQFQLTVNLVAIVIAFVGAVFGVTPLKAVQMLWVNLIMDTLAALALATESPYDALLDRRPYGKTDSIISKCMWRNIVSGALYQLVVAFVCLFVASPMPSDPTRAGFFIFPDVPQYSKAHLTFIFNMFVFFQIGNEFCSRKIYNEVNIFAGMLQAKLFLVILVVIVAMQVLMVELFGAFAQTEPLDYRLWLVSVGLGLCSIPWGVLTRLIKIRDRTLERVAPGTILAPPSPPITGIPIEVAQPSAPPPPEVPLLRLGEPETPTAIVTATPPPLQQPTSGRPQSAKKSPGVQVVDLLRAPLVRDTSSTLEPFLEPSDVHRHHHRHSRPHLNSAQSFSQEPVRRSTEVAMPPGAGPVMPARSQTLPNLMGLAAPPRPLGDALPPLPGAAPMPPAGPPPAGLIQPPSLSITTEGPAGPAAATMVVPVLTPTGLSQGGPLSARSLGEADLPTLPTA
ncbi:ion-transporting P-type ATPase [Paratrimastix pyriformis]|uniref:Ion-transporting P-type ATPase n=1 Tax=Paratrimastix pyriformis TaxID=342808 RepID=A0ABQ8UT67_9EUKA|nr:ion-transporting P-type ATPase [Paratrimastix pyriformis]